MASTEIRPLTMIFADDDQKLLEAWLQEQRSTISAQRTLLSEADLRRHSSEFLEILNLACRSGNLDTINSKEWQPTLNFLAGISRSRATQGFSPSETATFVFSLKQPIFARLRQLAGTDAVTLADYFWLITTLLDRLGLYTTEVHQKSREELIKRQQMEMLELSTPVVKLWSGILAVPLIGTLDSARTQIVMESLLQSIVDTASSIAIIDITGVPTVDTLIAQNLLKTIAAAKLMGAQCIVSGVRPQIALTMVQLGVELGDVVARATLAEALAYAFRQIGITVTHEARTA